MNKLIAACAAALLALSPLACNQSEKSTAPGSDGGFRLTGPVTSTDIKQGDRQTVNVGVSRDNSFTKSVKLTAEAPKGLKAELKNETAAAADKEVPLTISADKDATPGDHVVKVTGTPDGGKAVTLDVKVTVKKPTD